jgi:hypothetical protein
MAAGEGFLSCGGRYLGKRLAHEKDYTPGGRAVARIRAGVAIAWVVGQLIS